MRSMRCAITLASLLLSGVSVAGTKADFQVTYNSSSRSVSGSLSAIRNSPDSLQYLHCDILASVSAIQGTCYARDSGGNAYSCTTTAPNLLEAIRSISESSYVYFAWDTSGACTVIGVNNGSIYAPK